MSAPASMLNWLVDNRPLVLIVNLMVDRGDEHLDSIFRALAHPARRAILRRIARAEQTVTELAEPFDMSLEAVSKHVRVLEQARLVKRTRSGRMHRCRLRPEPLKDAAKVLAQLATLWNTRLDALDHLLSELTNEK
ncbi:MAG TPA: metalloregulator ArsR/SmtB family transcription factor [Polyangia bacterium]|nr:metalloregulator ArsR/SmtB family transcription factor [Polyangia bacterium]